MVKRNKLLVDERPDLAEQWHPTKNGDLELEKITLGYYRKVWWQHEHAGSKHEWPAVVNSRTLNNNGCPICSGHTVLVGFNDLATLCPEIAEEWHPTRNSELLPTMVTKSSAKIVWWQHYQDGIMHEWPTAIANRTGVNKSGCAVCNGKRVQIESMTLLL
jgi:hypothetical protein